MISRDRLLCRYATREYFGGEGPWDESHGYGMFHRAAMGEDFGGEGPWDESHG